MKFLIPFASLLGSLLKPYLKVKMKFLQMRGNLPLTGTPLTAGRKALRNFILGN